MRSDAAHETAYAMKKKIKDSLWREESVIFFVVFFASIAAIVWAVTIVSQPSARRRFAPGSLINGKVRCVEASDCPLGLVCGNGQICAECRNSQQCPSGQSCNDGLCGAQPLGEPAIGTAGGKPRAYKEGSNRCDGSDLKVYAGICARCNPYQDTNGCPTSKPRCEISPSVAGDRGHICVECLVNSHCKSGMNVCDQGVCKPLGTLLAIKHIASGAFIGVNKAGERPILEDKTTNPILWSLYTDSYGRGGMFAQPESLRGIVVALNGGVSVEAIAGVSPQPCDAALTPWDPDEVPGESPHSLVFLDHESSRTLAADELVLGRKFRILLRSGSSQEEDVMLTGDFGDVGCNCPGLRATKGSEIRSEDIFMLDGL